MKKLTLILPALFLLLWVNFAIGQQQAQFAQYMDNMLYYNPAYAGSRNTMSFDLLHRQQWWGVKGAPMSTTFNFHTPISIDNVGVGLSFLNSRVGPKNATWISLDLSYAIKLNEEGSRLAFGLNGGFDFFNADLAGLKKIESDDKTLDVQYHNQFKTNVGAGIYYSNKHWFAGFAIPRILNNANDTSDALNTEYFNKRHYYLMLGGYFSVNRMLKIRPSTLVQFTDGAPFSMDLSLAFIFYDKFWAGVNYRLLESAGILFQYQITPALKIGYAFEYSTTQLRSFNNGTHELMISYDLKFKGKSIASPRYF